MSILQALSRAYDRLPDAPPFGFSNQNISFVLSLKPNGTLAGAPIDIRDLSGKKSAPVSLQVPQPVKRTSGIAPNFLWDKTSYVLGLTAGEGKRLADEHQAFKDFHAQVLGDSDDEGLRALLAFLQSWTPDQVVAWPEDLTANLLDQNVVFALESQRLSKIYLHDRPAARQIWADMVSANEGATAICLVTGKQAPVQRLHPAIKGVWGGQTGGGSIVSFNLDAFTSYGHEQGDNAPVSEAAAFAYTTALNTFLAKGSQNRIQIGDASTVFWAEAQEPEIAEEADALFQALFGGADEIVEAQQIIKPFLEKLRAGQPLREVRPRLNEGVKFYVLGLAPNAARISIRFWYENDFGKLMADYQRFLSDMRIEPPDRDEGIPLWKYLRETAVLGKAENVQPNLAGEWMRAILTGGNYPLALFASILARIRADGEINARRASILKALLKRNFNLSDKEAPVAFDAENANRGYLLGRLFAVYEHIQSAALGRNVNATIKDKYYGAASAQPRKVFPLLDRGSANHLSKIGKQNRGRRVNLEKDIGAIMAMMAPGQDPYPAALSAEEQALFSLGYYHQRNFKKTEGDEQ